MRALTTIPRRPRDTSALSPRPTGRLARARRSAQPLGNTARLVPAVRRRGLFARLAGSHREAERILNGAARRLLAEQLEHETPCASCGSDGGRLDGRADQLAFVTEGQQVPVGRGADGDGRARSAS